MSSGTSTLDEAAVLAAARRYRREANTAEAGVLQQAVAWAGLHQITDPADAATWPAGRGQDTGIPLGGEGVPLVSEFAVAEFATALGVSAGSGRVLVAHAMELAHRLPRVWARVLAGDLAPWRARRIAEETLCLSLDAAGFVDQQVAGFAHRVGPAQTQRLVEDAIARFMPDYAAERRRDAAEARHFDIDTDQVSFAGTARVYGELDLADALDLDDAIRAGAADLAALGSKDSLDVRRAAAVGMLARGDQPLDLTGRESHSTAGGEPDTGTPSQTTHGSDGTGPATRNAVVSSRQVVLHVHLSADALRSHDADAPAWLENAGGQLLTAGQVADWCGRPDTTQITVKPVIDLNQPASTDAYKVPPWLAERVRLRDRTCVHPYCNRPARGCDLDHIVPFDSGGPTALDNLACLCRLHHRMKTHAGWTYSMLLPGTYLWHSPHGHTWLTDPHGTTDLTPDTVEPPRQPDTDPPERRTT